MDHAVEIDSLWVYYNNTPVLEDISVSINLHEFVSVIGPNGGGKTTLLRVILGLIRPQKGEVTVLGTAPRPGSGSIGYLPQYISFDTSFPISIFDVVKMGRYTHPLARYTEQDTEKVKQSLERVGMLDFMHRQIGTLSGGELQRVFLARALVRAPQLLLLDEPTANIDPEMRTSFYDLLHELKEDMTIIMVTHDVSIASSYVDSIACLNKRLFYHGSTEGALGKLEDVYGCPVEVLAHGIPHRVLQRHEE
jgi:zinc transport system ATP-binding protein